MLLDRIKDDMKQAMRDKAKDRLNTIRLILAATKQQEVDRRVELEEADVLAILDKMLKQRRDSIEQFDKAGRDDLSDKEKREVEVIQGYPKVEARSCHSNLVTKKFHNLSRKPFPAQALKVCVIWVR